MVWFGMVSFHDNNNVVTTNYYLAHRVNAERVIERDGDNRFLKIPLAIQKNI